MLGIVASSSPALFPQWDELFALHRHPVSAAESCCPRTWLLAAAGWGGAGQGGGMGTAPLFTDQATTPPLCMTEQTHRATRQNQLPRALPQRSVMCKGAFWVR